MFSAFAPHATGIVKKINLEDQSEARGVRAILITSVPQHLIGLNFNRNNTVEGSFSGKFETVANARRNSVTLTIEAFETLKQLNVPSGATHFRFVNSISVISDYAYNSVTKLYEPIESTLNEVSKVTYSDYIEIVPSENPEVSIVRALNGTPTMTDSVSLLSCVGIEFSQKAGSEYYVFSVGNSTKIKNVF